MDAVEVEEGLGIVGDARSFKGRGRQITIVSRDALDAAAVDLGYAVPAGASRRQVEVSGIDLDAAMGKTLVLGAIRVRVDSPCHPCRKMEIAIGPGGRAALKDRGGVCARVLGGGTLRTGDPVSLDG